MERVLLIVLAGLVVMQVWSMRYKVDKHVIAVDDTAGIGKIEDEAWVDHVLYMARLRRAGRPVPPVERASELILSSW